MDGSSEYNVGLIHPRLDFCTFNRAELIKANNPATKGLDAEVPDTRNRIACNNRSGRHRWMDSG
jgi:hypothetical protein